ncbi:MAG: pseudouridine synthase [Bacteroidales bacterium]|nr:pseudouridine synthase [Bacteroides sp.]MCM1197841.1 pseudouridine synthase [Clostridium sp.]MCM1503307.1 pseudouridine synthase [Bacteroidales bacterium]
MEDFKKGGYDRKETGDRREYGNRSFTNSERPSGEGRTRRPRISSSYASPNHVERRTYGSSERPQYRNYGDNNDRPRRSFGDGENRNFGGGEGRSFGDRPRRTYGDNNGPRRNFNSSSDRPHRSYGDNDRPRRNFGDGESRGFGGGEGRSFGDRPRRTYGDNNGPRRNFNSSSDRPYRSYGDNNDRPRRNFGDGENRNFGDRPRRNFGSGEGRSFGDRPRKQYGDRSGRSFGDKRSFNKRPARQFESRASEEGIDRMINRKPLFDASAFSDNDIVKVPVKETVRLNKYIANSGVCSRREADNFILAGVVTVNGEVVTELGSKVNIYTDDVRFNGERLKGEEKVYIVMNKPKGFVTTASDPHAEKTVMDLLKGCNSRVFPVGRLDKNTTGVLMFTNDGEIAEKLTHPSYDKKKIYQVSLNEDLKREDYETIKSGVVLTDGEIAADELEYIDEGDHRKLGIEIHSGKNRIVRRIFESLGYEVKALDRVYFAGLTKKGIKRGAWRFLTEGEVNILKMGAYN